MKVHTTDSAFNCGSCAFINLTGIEANKKTEMELSKTGKLKPFRASLYSSFLFWANKYNIELTVYTDSKKLNEKMFELMIHYEKTPEKLCEKYKALARKRFDGINRKFSSRIKGLKDPIKKLDELLDAGSYVAVLNSSFYLDGPSSVPHWIVAYGKKGGKYYFMCSVRGLITLSKKDLLRGFAINKKQGYAPVLIGYNKPIMKILVVGDFHGRRPVIKFKDFDAIVLVGDVCDDRDIAPLYKKWFRKLNSFEGDGDFLDFEKFAEGELKSKTKLRSYKIKSLKRGAEILRYLDSFGKPIFMVAGNWDQSYGKTRIKDMDKYDYNYLKSFYDFYLGDEINPVLTKGLKNIRNCMFHCHEFGGVNFVGYGLSSAPEDLRIRRKNKNWNGEKLNRIEIGKLKRAYAKIGSKLGDVYKKRKNKKLPAFFITHNVPNNTKLDLIKDKKSYAHGKHLGSTIARKFCLRFKPMICAGGHVHEGRGKDKIGKTIVINQGYGKRAQVLIDFDKEKGKIKKVEFVK